MIDAAQFSGLLPALQAGTYRFLAAPTTVTKERAENMLFTEGYLNTDFQFLIKKGSPKIKARRPQGQDHLRQQGLGLRFLGARPRGQYRMEGRELRHPDRCGAGGARRARRRQCRRQHRHRLGGKEQPAARAVLPPLDRSRLGRAVRKDYSEMRKTARERHRMHEAGWHDRQACTRNGSASRPRQARRRSQYSPATAFRTCRAMTRRRARRNAVDGLRGRPAWQGVSPASLARPS